MPNTVVKMPQLGESVSEGTIGRWLKQPGDRVERDEPLVEIQTDKVNAEVPSPVAGILQQILLPEGATASVKTDMAIIGDAAPDPSAGAPAPAPAAPTFTYDNAQSGGVVGHREPEPEAHPDGKRFYTPVVLRMAEEHAIDLSTIEGTGAHGRVTRKDVERAIAGGGATTPTPASPPPETYGIDNGTQPYGIDKGPQTQGIDKGMQPGDRQGDGVPLTPRREQISPPSPWTGRGGQGGSGSIDEDVPLSPMRRAIAQHMAQARSEIPDAWSLVEIDVTALVKHRDALQAEWQAREGYELTYLPFFIKAVLAGLRKVPELNAAYAGDHITVHREYTLGIAVSVPNGLVVPVLKGADQLSIAGLAGALRNLVQKARGGRLSMEDLQGATFTVNNPGSLGSIMSQPIVPVGQAGIVTMEAIIKRPVVTADDAIAVRSMMYSCLSFDHRVLDGSGALMFLRTLKHELENTEYPLY